MDPAKQAGWLAPIDHLGQLTASDAAISEFCTESTMFNGTQNPLCSHEYPAGVSGRDR
ncbi:MAG: hypothetical protein M3N26_03985 [Pseudomonadota bacterium]|nr:hypothetical protein [Pseudomonadota bacterium]